MAQRTYTAAADDDGRRLDRVARRLFPGEPLGRIFRAIRTGAVLLNGAKASPSARVAAGDVISASGLEAGRALRPLPRPLPLSVLFENEHVLALDKPEGMPVHGPDSVERLVAAHLEGRRASLSFRPGPAHRLDRGTSGLVLFSCSLAGAQELTRLFRERRVAKQYLAIVQGVVTGEATWEDLLGYDHDSRRAGSGDQTAVTRVVPLASGRGHTLLACFPLTGRTHQIRAQAALHGHPLAGDTKYGGEPGEPGGRYLLHSLALRLEQGGALLGFESLAAPAPPRFLEQAAALIGPEAEAIARAAGST